MAKKKPTKKPTKKPPPPPPEKEAKGATRMKELGNRRVDVWLSATEYDLIWSESVHDRRSMAAFIRRAALMVANTNRGDREQRNANRADS